MISPVTNLYELQFPIYISEPFDLAVKEFTIDAGIKKLVIGSQSTAYDIILDEGSTYLGRLMALNRLLDSNVIKFDYSFTNLAHLIYARPTFNSKSLLVDNLGQVRSLKPIYANGYCSKYSHRLGNYIFTKVAPTPLRIPHFPLLLDSLETYKPYVEMAVYCNTYFFKNLLPEARRNDKLWKIRIM